VKAGYEGGQMPLQRRLPKRGFRPVRKVVYQVVNIGALARDTQSIEYSPEVMKELGLIKYSDRPVKVLGSGTIDREIHVRAHSFSEAARRKITDVGGGVEVI
jgi:large subunit ribosomal protein L15